MSSNAKHNCNHGKNLARDDKGHQGNECRDNVNCAGNSARLSDHTNGKDNRCHKAYCKSPLASKDAVKMAHGKSAIIGSHDEGKLNNRDKSCHRTGNNNRICHSVGKTAVGNKVTCHRITERKQNHTYRAGEGLHSLNENTADKHEQEHCDDENIILLDVENSLTVKELRKEGDNYQNKCCAKDFLAIRHKAHIGQKCYCRHKEELGRLNAYVDTDDYANHGGYHPKRNKCRQNGRNCTDENCQEGRNFSLALKHRMSFHTEELKEKVIGRLEVLKHNRNWLIGKQKRNGDKSKGNTNNRRCNTAII